MITKAIVPVAGWGTRRLPITKVIEKSMLPIGNRPLVDYTVQELIAAGVKDIYMVISNLEPSQVKAYYSPNLALDQYLAAHGKSSSLALTKTLPDDVTIHYTVQDPAGKYGTAVPIALVMAEYHLDEPVLVYMGDDFIWHPDGESAAETLLKTADSDITSAILGVATDPSQVELYGVLAAESGRLVDIVEKPAPNQAPSHLINVSKYLMTPDLLQQISRYVNDNDFPPEREYLITEPIADFIHAGGVIRVAESQGQYLDGGSIAGWLHANRVVCSE